MDINFENISKCMRMVEALIIGRGNNLLEEDAIDNIIDETINILNIKCNDEEKTELKKNIEYKYQIHNVTPIESILSDYEQTNWYSEIKETIKPTFWSRYSDYLIDKKNFSPNIVSTLGNETIDNNLMNYIGNPESETPFLRRGLIIGDVQSGKTSTYIGFMCKAADAGYKVFILLTGTIESLRRQTQERVEEGFIGINTTAQERVGVGLDNKDILAMSLTSRSSDFNGKADQIAMSLAGKNAVVFVIKKNTSVLTKLTNWLITMNADKITKKIDLPMLLIDDEADNASINTSASKEDPTKINKLIRGLVDVFTKANYVGFTATPFANVFIDPLTTEEMENHDLFPEDFIISLPTPSNYIGPDEIFNNKGKYYAHLNYITDAGRQKEDGWSFYYKHQKEWDDELPESLTDAIYTFYLANAIRDLRGDIKADRSMLINISRFIITQRNIQYKVEEIHKKAYSAIKYNLSDDFESSMHDPCIKRLFRVWQKQYSNTEFSWENIVSVLYSSIEDIQIKVVNSSNKSEKLEYHEGTSLRVIAIGGLALSRGLTLEGLIVSYFYRNTSTYDVLMQMGRWFGYRKNYDDIFRIWIHEESAEWYAEIAEATNQLKLDMRRMRDLKRKPKDFGIRVRNNSAELSITARNKMRNAEDEYEYESYFGSIIETPYLSNKANDHIINYNAVKDMVLEALNNNLVFERTAKHGQHYLLQDIPKYCIVQLLNKLIIPKVNIEFNTRQLSDFIESCDDNSIDIWDVTFMEGTKDKNSDTIDIYSHEIYPVQRKCSIDVEREILKIGQRGKLGGTSDGMTGLSSDKIIDQAKKDFEIYYNEHAKDGLVFEKGMTYPSNTWFKFVKNRKPLLIIYLISPKADDKTSSSQVFDDFIAGLDGNPIIGFAIGMPQNNTYAETEKTRYKANKIYNWFEQDELLEENEEVE